MDIVLFILRILIAVALYVFLGALLWVLLRKPAPKPTAAVPTARLIEMPAVESGVSGRTYEIKTAAWIGRDPNCLVCVDDDFASSRHAQVLWRAEDAAWWIEDNLSRNGTFVNDARLTSAKLNDGDVIRVGQARFEFRA